MDHFTQSIFLCTLGEGSSTLVLTPPGLPTLIPGIQHCSSEVELFLWSDSCEKAIWFPEYPDCDLSSESFKVTGAGCHLSRPARRQAHRGGSFFYLRGFDSSL